MTARSFPLPSRRAAFLATAAALLLLAANPARAVILYGVDTSVDTTANTMAPTGALADSGWQFEGQFGRFLGTPIAPNYFITAAHFGGEANVGTPFVYQGTTYTVDAGYSDPNSDLRIYHVTDTFSTYAQLYTKPGDEVGLGLVVFGRGTQRGAGVTVGADSHLGGWLWGAADNVQRYGTNTVSSIENSPTLGNFLHANFDMGAGVNEATLSDGDSGGGVFVKDTDGVWKLAGVNYGVDGPFSRSLAGTNQFNAAMFDTTGLYEYDGAAFVPASNPSGMYATEIASDLGFIYGRGIVPEPSSAAVVATGIGAALCVWLFRRQRSCRS